MQQNLQNEMMVKESNTISKNQGFCFKSNHTFIKMTRVFQLSCFLMVLIMASSITRAMAQVILKGGKQNLYNSPPSPPNLAGYKQTFKNNTQQDICDFKLIFDMNGKVNTCEVSSNGKTEKPALKKNKNFEHVILTTFCIPPGGLFTVDLTFNPVINNLAIIPTDTNHLDLLRDTVLNPNTATPDKPGNNVPISGGYQKVKFYPSDSPMLQYDNESGQDVCDIWILNAKDKNGNAVAPDSVFINKKKATRDPKKAGHYFFDCILAGQTAGIGVCFPKNSTVISYSILPTNKDTGDILTSIHNFHPGTSNETVIDFGKDPSGADAQSNRPSGTFVNDTKQEICDLIIKADKIISKVKVNGAVWPIKGGTAAKEVHVDGPCIAKGATFSVTIFLKNSSDKIKGYTITPTNKDSAVIFVANCSGMNSFQMPNENSKFGISGRSGSLVAINESCSPISQLVFTSPDPGISIDTATSTTSSFFDGLNHILFFNSPVMPGDTLNYCFILNHLLPYSPTDTFPYTTVNVNVPGVSSPMEGEGSVTLPTCNSSSNGSIDFSMTTGGSPFNYLWSNATTTEDQSNITAGTYTVTVTSSSGCMQKSFIVPAGVPSLNIIPVDATCSGANSGMAVAIVEGLDNPTYSWTNGTTAAVNMFLNAGPYGVVVTDGSGCIVAGTANISQPAPVTLSGSVTNAQCNGSKTGMIDITASGGSGVYKFKWNNSSTAEDRSLLAAGNYSVTATDGFGCSVSGAFIVGQPVAMAISFTKTNVNCAGAATGKLVAKATTGVAPYLYNWSNGTTGKTASNLVAGTYTVTVTDANGCTKTKTSTITQNLPMNIMVMPMNPTQAVANVNGGVPPYFYQWGTMPVQTTQFANGLQPGQTYSLMVQDQMMCMQSVQFTMPFSRMEDANQANSFDVSAYPNPASGSMTVKIAHGADEQYTLEMLDVTGRIVFKSVTSSNNEYVTKIDLTGFAYGVYSLRAGNADNIQVIKVVVQ